VDEAGHALQQIPGTTVLRLFPIGVTDRGPRMSLLVTVPSLYSPHNIGVNIISWRI
jgi:hypothetical protein